MHARARGNGCAMADAKQGKCLKAVQKP